MRAWFGFLVRRRWLVLAIVVVAAAAGVWNMTGLSIDEVPDISPKQVMVLTQSPGLGPLEVERLVTFPVENAMAGATGVKELRSTSRYGVSAVYVTFDDDVPIAEARVESRSACRTPNPTCPAALATRAWDRWRPVSARSTSSSCRARAIRR